MKLQTCLVLSSALATAALVQAADPPARPKDAAEAIQEGNVRNWVEYYERMRQSASVPGTPATGTPVATPSSASPPDSVIPATAPSAPAGSQQ